MDAAVWIADERRRGREVNGRAIETAELRPKALARQKLVNFQDIAIAANHEKVDADSGPPVFRSRRRHLKPRDRASVHHTDPLCDAQIQSVEKSCQAARTERSVKACAKAASGLGVATKIRSAWIAATQHKARSSPSRALLIRPRTAGRVGAIRLQNLTAKIALFRCHSWFMIGVEFEGDGSTRFRNAAG